MAIRTIATILITSAVGCAGTVEAPPPAPARDDLQAAGPYTCLLYGDAGLVRCRGNMLPGVSALGFTRARAFGMRETQVCALDEEGLECIDLDQATPPALLADGTDMIAVRPPCAVLASGAVECFGEPAHAEALTDVVDIAILAKSACGLHRNGTVSCVGDVGAFEVSVEERLGGADDVVALSTDGTFSYCALRRGGEVACWGLFYMGAPTLNDSASLANASAIGGGLIHNCAIQNGDAWCWGYITDIGGTRVFGDAPAAVPGATQLVDVDGGWYHTCALGADGRVFCVGDDTFAQTGRGDSLEFIEVEGF